MYSLSTVIMTLIMGIILGVVFVVIVFMIFSKALAKTMLKEKGKNYVRHFVNDYSEALSNMTNGHVAVDASSLNRLYLATGYYKEERISVGIYESQNELFKFTDKFYADHKEDKDYWFVVSVMDINNQYNDSVAKDIEDHKQKKGGK